MVLFSFLLTILYFETRFDYDDNMQDIYNWLGDSILIGSAYKMTIDMGTIFFRFSYFKVVW